MGLCYEHLGYAERLAIGEGRRVIGETAVFILIRRLDRRFDGSKTRRSSRRVTVKTKPSLRGVERLQSMRRWIAASAFGLLAKMEIGGDAP